MEPEVSKLATAEQRLRDEIRAIVRHRIPWGMRLNWRIMFEIEDEAVARLEEDEDLDLHYVNVMVSPSAQRSPNTEKPAELADILPMHTAFRMIQEAYQREHCGDSTGMPELQSRHRLPSTGTQPGECK